MHELGLCDALLKKLREVAEESELEGVNFMSLEIGSLSGVVPSFMEDCWQAVIDGTEFSQTKLFVTSVPGKARCADCGCEFEVDLDKMFCPQCSGRRLIPVSGNDITITQIEGY